MSQLFTGYNPGYQNRRMLEMEARAKVKPVYYVVSRSDRGREIERMKMPDGTWKFLGNGRPRFGNGINAHKTPKTEKMKKDTIQDKKVARTQKEVAKRRFVPNTERSPIDKKVICRTDKNPSVVKIMSDAEKIAAGWRYVQIDARTRALRKPKSEAA
jgi:hypothetical protein